MTYCNTEGCLNHAADGSLRCLHHISKDFQASIPLAGKFAVKLDATNIVPGFGVISERSRRMSDLYPKYYKAVPKDWDSMDTYAVNILFPVDDPSGCILHARKKLLVPGVRSGGKSMRKDITEARDTLNRWLELNPE